MIWETIMWKAVIICRGGMWGYKIWLVSDRWRLSGASQFNRVLPPISIISRIEQSFLLKCCDAIFVITISLIKAGLVEMLCPSSLIIVILVSIFSILGRLNWCEGVLLVLLLLILSILATCCSDAGTEWSRHMIGCCILLRCDRCCKLLTPEESFLRYQGCLAHAYLLYRFTLGITTTSQSTWVIHKRLSVITTAYLSWCFISLDDCMFIRIGPFGFILCRWSCLEESLLRPTSHLIMSHHGLALRVWNSLHLCGDGSIGRHSRALANDKLRFALWAFQLQISPLLNQTGTVTAILCFFVFLMLCLSTKECFILCPHFVLFLISIRR